MKHIFTLLFLLFFFSLSFSQEKTKEAENPYIDNIIKPEPSAYNFANYGNKTSNMFSGVPDISVPIWTLEESNLKIPISLKYDAQGIKVKDTPGWVGVGWNLIPGGVITRIVRGKHDESYSETYMGYIYTPELFDENSLSGLTYIERLTEMEKVTKGMINDFQPDEFYFNFHGHSGKFIYSKTKNEFIVNPFSNMKISYEQEGDYIVSFTILTDDGYEYTFNNYEQSTTITTTGGIHEITSGAINSWYLSELVSPLGKNITFLYDTDELEKNEISNERLKIALANNKTMPYHTLTTSEITKTVPRLRMITSQNQQIEFVPKDIARTDVQGNMFALDRIEISRITNSKNVDLIKTFFMYTNYEIGDRLTLKEIKEVAGGEEIPSYKFSYQDPYYFPELTVTNMQDHWGYFNGEIGQNSLPIIELTDIDSQEPLFINSNGYIKDTKPDWVGTGVLNRIDYPTGGYTLFEYETNVVDNFSYSLNIDFPVLITYPYENLKAEICNENPSSSFYLSNTKQMKISFDEGDGNCEGGGPGPGGDEWKGGKDYHGLAILIESNDYSRIFGVENYTELPVTESFELEAGSYTISFNNGNIPSRGVNVELFENSFGTDYSNGNYNYNYSNQYVGGLRIKTMLDYTKDNNIALKKRYSYYGGKIFSTPVYLRTLQEYEWVQRETGDDYVDQKTWYLLSKRTFGVISSTNLGTDGNVQGSHVGYSKVTEDITNADGKIIRKEKSFYNIGDANVSTTNSDIVYNYPFAPVSNIDPKIGKIKNEYIYENTSTENTNNFNLVSFTDFDYTVDETGGSQGFVFGKDVDLGTYLTYPPGLWVYSPHPPNVGNTFSFYSMKNYEFITNFININQVSTTHKYGYEEVNSITDYLYNDYYLQQKIENSNNDLIKLTTSYKYPTDENLNANVPQEMIDNFMISTPVETETKNANNDIISANITDYKYENGMVLPDKVRVYNKDLTQTLKYEERASYKHNEHGNIVEIKKTDNIPTTIIWGYNNTYPIAKIEGITYDELSSTQITEIQRLDAMVWTYENRDILKMRNIYIQNMLPNAMITTYTYRPLLGQETITAPNGTTMFYKYDDFGRLETIRDQDGKVIKQIEYNYKNETKK